MWIFQIDRMLGQVSTSTSCSTMAEIRFIREDNALMCEWEGERWRSWGCSKEWGIRKTRITRLGDQHSNLNSESKYLVIYHDLAKVKCSQKLREPSYSGGAITQMSTFGVYSKYHTPGGTCDFSECLSEPKVSTVAQWNTGKISAIKCS